MSAILAVLLIATAPEEFGILECTTTIEAAGLDGPHRWGIILPNSSRVSLLTYKAIVAVRYPELVLHDQDPIQIGHFVPHDYTVGQGGFRTVLWEVPRYSRDLLAAIEDIVVFLNYLQKCYRDLNQGATAQLLVMCNRTAVHTQLLQHGFQAAWFGGLRIATTSSAAGATARIAEWYRQDVVFSVEDGEGQRQKTKRIALDEPQLRSLEPSSIRTLSPPLIWLG